MSEYPFKNIDALLEKITNSKAENPTPIAHYDIVKCHFDMVSVLSKLSSLEFLEMLLISLVTGGIRVRWWAAKGLYGWGKMCHKHRKDRLERELSKTESESEE